MNTLSLVEDKDTIVLSVVIVIVVTKFKLRVN